VPGAKARDESVVCLDLTVVTDQGRQGLAPRQMPGGVPVALGLGTIERVLDHGPPQQYRRERMGPLQPSCHRIEQIVEVAVDLVMAVEDEMGGLSVCWPRMEEIQRDRKTRNPSACCIARSSASTSSKSGNALR
jgi:hypothetical protein